MAAAAANNDTKWDITNLQSMTRSVNKMLSKEANADYVIDVTNTYRQYAIQIAQVILLGQKLVGADGNLTVYGEFVSNITNLEKRGPQSFKFTSVVLDEKGVDTNADGTAKMKEYKALNGYRDIVEEMFPDRAEGEPELIPFDYFKTGAVVQALLIVKYTLDYGITFGGATDRDTVIARLSDPVNQLTRVAEGVVSLVREQEERNNQLITQLEYLASRQMGVKFDAAKMKDLPENMQAMIRAQEDEAKRNDVIAGIIDTIRNDANPYEKIREELRKQGITDEGQVKQAIQFYERQRFGRIGVNFGDLQYIEEKMRELGASREEIKKKQEEYLEGKFKLPSARVKSESAEKDKGVTTPALNIIGETTGQLSRYESHPKRLPDIELDKKDTQEIIRGAEAEKKIKEKRQSFILRKITQEVKQALKSGELPSLKLTPVQKDIYDVPTDSGFPVIPQVLALPKEYKHESDETMSYFFI